MHKTWSASSVTITAPAGSVAQTQIGGRMSDADAARGALCPCAGGRVSRRALLGTGFGLAARAATAQTDAARERPKEGDRLVRVGNAELAPLSPDSLALGAGQVFAWPMDRNDNVLRDASRLNKVLL